MLYLSRLCGVFFIALILLGCNNEAPVSTDILGNESAALAKQNDDDDDDEELSRANIVIFQAAGSFGGGVLIPGTFFPPTNRGISTLRRDDIIVVLHMKWYFLNLTPCHALN